MAVNPMQRKARNSFLLGMLVMLVIAAIIIAFLVIQLKNYMDKENAEKQASVNIAVLNQSVKSGQIITADMLTQKTVNRNLIPSDAIGDVATLSNYNLEDKEGNAVTSSYDSDNEETRYYITIDGTEYELFQEENTLNYYINVRNEKQYLELNSVPVVAKVTMQANTVLTRELVTSGDNTTSNDVRREEYNMIVLPSQLETGDYIDIRLVLPSGLNYIVVSKKEVTIPEVSGIPSENTIWVNLTEGEISLMSNAIVEAYRMDGAKLYANIYTEPGMQDAAIPTYTPSSAVAELIRANPNIIETARQELESRYNAGQRLNVIDPAVNANGQTGDTNVKSNVEEEITTTKENRKDYLDSLASTTNSTTN